MRSIPLNKGLFAIVDDIHYDELSKYKWYAVKDYNTFYAKRRHRTPDGKCTTIFMHRQILGLDNPLVYCDHINGDGIDNRVSNLRICTNSENQHNSKIRSDNKTGYKGVSFCKASGKFRTRLKLNGKQVMQRYFPCPIEAARAYDEAAKFYHGEFARLNFPKP